MCTFNPLPSDRLRCCDRYIRCQRSLAVKPLTMSGSPSHRESVCRVSRSQVTHVPISNCSCSMCATAVSKLMSTCGNNSCASGGDRRCASNGAFSTGVPVDWGLFQRPARIDCGLSFGFREARLWLVKIINWDIEKFIFKSHTSRDLEALLASASWPLASNSDLAVRHTWFGLSLEYNVL